jgi:GT2 family glycosyltransferase
MNGPAPTVSVVIPTYNRRDVVRRAIESALAQTYPPIEIIVIDDGSTDDTQAVLADYGARIRLIRQPNAGVCAARNRGIDAAGGDFVAFLDSDDAWEPWKIASQMAAFAAEPSLVVVFTDAAAVNGAGQVVMARCLRRFYAASYAYFGEQGPFDRSIDLAWQAGAGTLRVADLSSRIWVGNMLHLSTVMVRRAALLEVGGFDASVGNAGEDYELFSRVVQLGLAGLVDLPAARCEIGRADRLSGLRVHTAMQNMLTMRRIEQRLGAPLALPAAMIAARRRDAALWLGEALFDDDRPAEARPHLWSALRLGARSPRGVAYFVLACLPRPVTRLARACLRAVRGTG